MHRILYISFTLSSLFLFVTYKTSLSAALQSASLSPISDLKTHSQVSNTKVLYQQITFTPGQKRSIYITWPWAEKNIVQLISTYITTITIMAVILYNYSSACHTFYPHTHARAHSVSLSLHNTHLFTISYDSLSISFMEQICKNLSLWRLLKSSAALKSRLVCTLYSIYPIITDTISQWKPLSKFRIRSSTYRLTAALSFADLPLGFSSTSSLLGSTTFLCSRTQWTLSLPPLSSSASSSSSSLLWKWVRALWRMLRRGGALRSSPLRKRLVMRSSSEWKVRTERRPPGRRRSWAVWSPATSSFSSSFTKIRSAWKVLVATWEGLCRRSRRA